LRVVALGAQLSDVQKLIVRQGIWLAAIGSLLGLASPRRRPPGEELPLRRRHLPIAFIGIALILLTIAFHPCWISGRRDDPMTCLCGVISDWRQSGKTWELRDTFTQ